jgi:hypothetical protein
MNQKKEDKEEKMDNKNKKWYFILFDFLFGWILSN